MLICLNCYKPKEILEALDKLQVGGVHSRCKDCGATLEDLEVVIRGIRLNEKSPKKMRIPPWLEWEMGNNSVVP